MIDANLTRMYPELVESGGLLPAIRAAFAQHPTIEINGFGTGAHYAHLAAGSRSADVYIGAAQRIFLFGLCEESACQVQGETPEFDGLVGALTAWLLRHSSVTELVSAHPFCESHHRKTT